MCGLQSLERIDFGENSLHGTLTEDLKKCTRLRVLDLGCNYFSGEVPELSLLGNLSFLNLNNSGFSGKFPWKSLENLTKLGFLSLGDNPFDSSPFPEEVLKLDKLYWLYLTNCSITGQIPGGIQNLTQLQNLELSDNQLSGEIPTEIVKLKKLWQLELYNNSLTGKLPAGFGNLTSLVNFDASQNRLEGDLSELRNLNQLASLHLFQNQFSGEIPQEFGDFKHLIEFSLYTNKLTGSLPQKIGSWADLVYIDVSENFLTGQIPPEMCKNGKMTDLLLLQNKFTGTIPESYANCKSLVRLRINNNSLSGVVPPGIWSLPNLFIIDLTANQFEGPVTGDIGNAKSLAQLFLANNRFSGELPSMISQASSLVSIQLSSNSFSGQIPSNICQLKKLNSLYLNENMFSGSIPDSIVGFAGNPGLCTQNDPCSSNSGKSHHHLRKILWCLIAAILVLLISLACYLIAKLKQNNLEIPLKQNAWRMKSFRVLSFTEREIIDSIKPENFIGKGGSGNVYKVVLANGKELAVKHIWPSKSNDQKSCRSSSAMITSRTFRSTEYEAEVATLSAVRHVNVVKLYCSITSEDSNLLVYEYLPNGSLWDRLHTCNKIKMGWEVRYAIAVGAAKGLEYLHHGCDRPAGDGGDWTHAIAGTHGYIAPEYAYAYKVNEKSDVYSFGVVLMELVTGKRPIEAKFGENKDIVNWMCSKINSKESLVDVVDSIISEDLKEDALNVLRIAIHCTAKNPAHRPSMRMVVQMLEDAEPCLLTNIVVDKEDVRSPNSKT
ncbi:hypothetical protein JRO89_XS02G0122800 [Xanthoceras sorbifolium]|uniref:Protein kinase domain-containing protein n=1 Tax=Xanthoceras sorbifolium TaxID=99658 RepID=A0ABQ8IFS1_9ROSI|nr:hypothetical protein JRO89_XS02G0122800 [Xanthoceras sorbifolium]